VPCRAKETQNGAADATGSDAIASGLAALVRILARDAAKKWYHECQPADDPTTEP
jgi:hypothetical protein